MIILTIRTDKPEAELGIYDDEAQIGYEIWQAHRELAETIHKKLLAMLTTNDARLEDIKGIVAYRGPGSFTGLRIGLSVANALAYGLSIPIVGDSGEDWITSGIARLKRSKGASLVLPEYGAPVHITQQKK